MKDITKQVVILDHFYSPYIRQAILILNDGAPAEQTQIINEAERIINAYLNRRQPKRKRRVRRIDLLCAAVVVIGISLFVVSRFFL